MGGTGGSPSGGTGTTVVVSVPQAAAVSPSPASGTPRKPRRGAKLTTGRIVVVKHTVHGLVASIVVKTPGAGRILVDGSRIDQVRRHVGRARRLSFRVLLSSGAAKIARRAHHSLSLKVRIVFAATHGRRSHAIVRLRFR